jgi:hypothetical protein
MKKGSIWLLFILVTFIQIIGNVFFTYQDIDINNVKFLSWIELIQPWFEDWSVIDHRRLLALVQGGTLPFMSLIALHFYIKFNENLSQEEILKKNSLIPQDEDAPKDIERIAENLEVSPTEDLQKNEKKDTDDQIHISEESEDVRNRRRLHPSRY